jgi:hypothetical protein
LLTFEKKEVYALKSKLQILDSKIQPLQKALEEAKKYQLAFQKNSANGHFKSDLIISNPTPTTHSTTRTTNFSTLIVDLDPCPICKTFYANHEFVVASCDYLYHLWCIAIHVHLSVNCIKESCGNHLISNGASLVEISQNVTSQFTTTCDL